MLLLYNGMKVRVVKCGRMYYDSKLDCEVQSYSMLNENKRFMLVRCKTKASWEHYKPFTPYVSLPLNFLVKAGLEGFVPSSVYIYKPFKERK